jgi:uncharacterized protein YpmS
MIERISERMIALAVGILALVLVTLFATSQCSKRKTAAKQAEVAEGQAGAAIDSGAEAVNTAANVAASDDATDARVAAAQKEIAAAAKGQKGEAAKRAACRFKAYKETPQCK